MKKLDAQSARDVLQAAHDAWCKADIELMLTCYADDVTYWCNAGLDGEPYVLEGKAAFRTFLRSILAVAESASVPESFQFENGVGRAQIEAFVRHRRTGHVLSGSYRQVVSYRGRKILKVEEFHDAAKMAAFWRLVTSEKPEDDHGGEGHDGNRDK